MRSFVKLKPLQNCKTILSSSDAGKSYQNREFSTRQLCLLTLFAKIILSRKFRIYSSLDRYRVDRYIHAKSPCTDPESFVQGGPNLPFFFLFDLFVWFDPLRPITNLSVMKGRVYLG